MPTYVYQCEAGVEYDVTQRITDPKLSSCPVCEKCIPKRLIASAPQVSFVSGPSGGWSNTGYGHTPGQLDTMRQLGRPLTKPAK